MQEVIYKQALNEVITDVRHKIDRAQVGLGGELETDRDRVMISRYQKEIKYFRLILRILQGYIPQTGPVPEDGFYQLDSRFEPVYYSAGVHPKSRRLLSDEWIDARWHGPIVRLELEGK